LLGLAPANLFLLKKVKEELAGLSFNQDSLKNNWEGVSRDITADELAQPSGGSMSAAKSV